MIKKLFYMIKMNKLILLTIVLMNLLLVSFASFFLSMGLNINTSVESIKSDSDYLRQINFSKEYPEEFTVDRVVKKIDEIEYQQSDLTGIIDLGYINNKNFILESEINSEFTVIGNNFKINNDVIVSYDFLTEHGEDILGSEIVFNYENENYIYNIVGAFDINYSEHLIDMKIPNVILYSEIEPSINFTKTINTVEMDSINDVKEFSKNKKYVYEISSDFTGVIDQIGYLNFGKYVALFLFVSFLIFSVLTSKLFVIATLDENKDTIFLLITLGIKNKTIKIFILTFTLIFTIFITLISLLINMLFSKILLNLELSNIDLFSINYLSYFIIFLFYFILVYIFIYYNFQSEMKKLKKGEKNV